MTAAAWALALGLWLIMVGVIVLVIAPPAGLFATILVYVGIACCVPTAVLAWLERRR